jgi:cell wall-associated NlpC family hydrolase
MDSVIQPLTIEEILAQRAGVVAESVRWKGTPYHDNARIRGAGADCLTSIAGVFEGSGATPHIEIPFYSKDWHLHKKDPRYLDGLLQYCDEMPDLPKRRPKPADLMMWQFGPYSFSHAAIVIEWPIVMHAYSGRPFGRENVEQALYLSKVFEIAELKGQPRPRKVFTLKTWAGGE